MMLDEKINKLNEINHHVARQKNERNFRTEMRMLGMT